MQEFRHEVTGDMEAHFSQAETQELLSKRMNALQDRMLANGFMETKRIKIGRNDDCPCGSGNKFKKCCISKAK